MIIDIGKCNKTIEVGDLVWANSLGIECFVARVDSNCMLIDAKDLINVSDSYSRLVDLTNGVNCTLIAKNKDLKISLQTR